MQTSFSRDLISKLLQFFSFLHTFSHCQLFPSFSFHLSRFKVWWDIRPSSASAFLKRLTDSQHFDPCGPRVGSVILLLLLLVKRGSFLLHLFADFFACFLKSLIVVGFDDFLPCLPNPKIFKCLPCLSQWKEPSMLKSGFGSSKPRQEEIANALKSFISKMEGKAILSQSVFYYPSYDLYTRRIEGTFSLSWIGQNNS